MFMRENDREWDGEGFDPMFKLDDVPEIECAELPEPDQRNRLNRRIASTKPFPIEYLLGPAPPIVKKVVVEEKQEEDDGIPKKYISKAAQILAKVHFYFIRILLKRFVQNQNLMFLFNRQKRIWEYLVDFLVLSL